MPKVASETAAFRSTPAHRVGTRPGTHSARSGGSRRDIDTAQRQRHSAAIPPREGGIAVAGRLLRGFQQRRQLIRPESPMAWVLPRHDGQAHPPYETAAVRQQNRDSPPKAYRLFPCQVSAKAMGQRRILAESDQPLRAATLWRVMPAPEDRATGSVHFSGRTPLEGCRSQPPAMIENAMAISSSRNMTRQPLALSVWPEPGTRADVKAAKLIRDSTPSNRRAAVIGQGALGGGKSRGGGRARGDAVRVAVVLGGVECFAGVKPGAECSGGGHTLSMSRPRRVSA